MEVHPAEILIAIQSIQGTAALVMAALLLYFYRSYRQDFLHHWALSSLALSIYLVASAAALGLYWAGPEYATLRFVFSCISLGAAYPHVVWLMIGTWEAVQRKVIRRGTELKMVAAAAVFGVFSARLGAFDPQAVDLRNLLRVDLRYVLTALAFLIAGVLLWRAQRRSGLIGARIAAGGFCLFGAQMMHVVGINIAQRAGYSPPFYFSYVGLVDFLFQSVIALGIVVWLLELQQQRTRRAHSALAHARLHDPTTGLPNREMLIDQIAHLIGSAGKRRIAVVSLGMNRFAMLNRALGWQRTEQIVNEVSRRLRKTISRRCALGRLSDRDFVIVRPTTARPEELRAWAETLLAGAIRPVDLEGQEVFVTFCAGISIYPDDASDPELLLQHSQHALLQSAQIGRDVTLYQQIAGQRKGEEEAALRFEGELRRGLSEGQFELYYQPIMTIRDSRAAGFEALLRWRHPERGVLRPAAFLDEAASIGLLDALESFALESALEQLARWNRQGQRGFKVAVNVSAQRFQSADLVADVIEACRRFRVKPQQLELEITENTALRDLANASRQIAALQQAGITVALDDFGTGYSSLANLINLPVSRIKLDLEFLKNVVNNKRQRDLVAAMIALGHQLGLEVVAEGVESAAQLEFLAEHGCDLVQGYLLQKPAVPAKCELHLAAVAV